MYSRESSDQHPQSQNPHNSTFSTNTMSSEDTHPPASPPLPLPPPPPPSTSAVTPHRWETASSLEDDGAFYTTYFTGPIHQETRTQLVQHLGRAGGPFSYSYNEDYPVDAPRPLYGMYHHPYCRLGVPCDRAFPTPAPVTTQDWKSGTAIALPIIPPPPPANQFPIAPDPTTPKTPRKKRGGRSTSPVSPASVASTASVAAAATSPSAKRRKRGKPEFKIKHNYHDNSGMTFDGYMHSHPGHKPAREFKDHMSFPRALHAMLDFVAESGQADIVSWNPHGRAFTIHKPEEFTNLLIPKYYQMKNYASFLRQLNIYGFKCISKDGPDKGAHYHELFLRGKVDLSRAMGRVKIKGTRHKGANNPEDEPDFLAYPALDEEAQKAKDAPKEAAITATATKASPEFDPIPVCVSLDSTERTAMQQDLGLDIGTCSLLEEAFFGSASEPPTSIIEGTSILDTKASSTIEPKDERGPSIPAGYVPPLPDDISDIFFSDKEDFEL